MNMKQRMAMLQQAERMKKRDHALSNVERQGSEALSNAKSKGSIASAIGGFAGSKLGSMAMGGLLGAMTGGVINPLTLQMMTGVGSALGSGLLAGGAGRMAMGQGPKIKANSDFADVNLAAQDTMSELDDTYDATAMGYGINAAKAAAMAGAGKYMGRGSAYAKGAGEGAFNYDSLKGSGLSRFQYDKKVFDAQNAFKKAGGHLLDDPWA